MVKQYTIFLFLLAIALPSCKLFASPQMPDYIIYKGDTIATYNLILEQYFQMQEKTKSDRLFGLSFRNRPNGGLSFNCWRAYQAIYKIESDSLFLVNIIDCGERGYEKAIDYEASSERMKIIFTDKVINNRVFITWFTGDLNFPLNKVVLRWDGIFYKIFEKETVIDIIAGKLIKVQDVNNYVDDPKSIDRRDKSKISEILFKKIKKVKWADVDEYDCSDKYLVTINEEGKVSKVTMPDYRSDDSIDKYWDRDEYNYCINNIFNALKKLKFDIIKDKGKPISEEVYLELWFDDKKGKIENWTR